MLGVDAHAEAAWFLHLREDAPEVLEEVAHAGALAGGVLEEDGRALPSGVGEDEVERLHDPREPRVVARAEVRAGVQHAVGDAERARSLHLGDQRGPGLPEDLAVVGGEVDEVARVGEHRGAGERGLRLFELRDLRGRHLGLAPHARVLGEDLDGPAAVGRAALEREVEASRHRLMSAEEHEGRI